MNSSQEAADKKGDEVAATSADCEEEHELLQRNDLEEDGLDAVYARSHEDREGTGGCCLQRVQMKHSKERNQKDPSA